MDIEFGFRKEQSGIFGPVLRPVAEIVFINGNKELAELAYVDSGADITLIPKSVGDFLGFEIKKTDEIIEMKGIGERGIPAVIKQLKIKIGNKILDAKIAWALIEEVPLLLGRIDVFKLFEINFKKEKSITFSD